MGEACQPKHQDSGICIQRISNTRLQKSLSCIDFSRAAIASRLLGSTTCAAQRVALHCTADHPGLKVNQFLDKLLDVSMEWSSSLLSTTHTLVYMTKGGRKAWWKSTIWIHLPDMMEKKLDTKLSRLYHRSVSPPSWKCRWCSGSFVNVIRISPVGEECCLQGKQFGPGLKIPTLGVRSSGWRCS